jgi:CRP-like cAMP-binding protein
VPTPEQTFRASLQHLAPIPDAEWRFARTLLRPTRLAKGEHLTRQGEVATEFGWIHRGLVRKYYVDAGGRERVRGFAAEGQIAGAYASLLTRAPATLSVQAAEPTELLVMDAAQLDALYARHVCWQQVGRRIAEQLFVERERREHQLLTLSATERYEAFLREHPQLAKRVPRHQVAAYLGITPVSLSRLAARLRRAAVRA